MVLTLPTDSNYMSLVRLSDGAQLTKPHARSSYDQVLGVSNGTIVLAGNEERGGGVVTFYGITREKKVGLENLKSEVVGRDKLNGHGVLCHDAVYVPTERKIVSVRLGSGKHHTVLTWDDKDTDRKKQWGDLVVGGGHFFTVGARNAHTFKEDE
jgi:hypothetical protein